MLKRQEQDKRIESAGSWKQGLGVSKLWLRDHLNYA
jgi:hypothetical protein